MPKSFVRPLTVAVTGLAFWKLAQAISGVHEVWDAPSYLRFYGAALGLSAAFGYLFPRRAGLWGAIVMLSQFPIMMIGGPGVGANLWPIGLLLTGLLAIPAAGAALAAAQLRKPRSPS